LDIEFAHWNFIGRLIESTGCTVIAPLYPLAPENKCAALIPEMVSLYSEFEQTYGANNMTLMGDSAGGGLSLALAHALRDKKFPAPDRLVLLSPWLDVTGTHPDQPTLEKKDTMIAVSGLKGFGEMYAGDLALDDPRVSPLFGNHSNLPPIQVFASSAETLFVDSTRFRDMMQDLGTPVSYHEYEDMFHVWPLLPIPEGKQALREIVEFLT
jgi:acetyl esterase/lipase